MSNKKDGLHGDNKDMISARRRFLNQGYYSIIIDKLSDIIINYRKKHNLSSTTILDAGCGEGYYSGGIYKALSLTCSEDSGSPKAYDIYGIDVSKEAILLASKTYKEIKLSVASINALPFQSKSFNIVISLFAPLSENEFHRVLKDDGILITVSPSPRHLFGLKEQIYEKPYENPISTFFSSKFKRIQEDIITSEITLSSSEVISDLFSMTPYYYNTDKSGKEKVKTLIPKRNLPKAS
jgi:23S rRNA (guanine745-N1)-methyltransferase